MCQVPCCVFSLYCSTDFPKVNVVSTRKQDTGKLKNLLSISQQIGIIAKTGMSDFRPQTPNYLTAKIWNINVKGFELKPYFLVAVGFWKS